MKKHILTSAIMLALPIIALSAPSLASRLQGKILLAVEDKGKTYYVNNDGKKYRITKDTAQKIFEKLALGITNDDLNSIPDGEVAVDINSDSCNCPVVNCPAVHQTTCDYTPYTSMIGKYEGLIDETNNAFYKLKNVAEQYKAKYNDCISGQFSPQNSQNTDTLNTYVPLTRCYGTGIKIECYDYNKFPQSLRDQLEQIANRPGLFSVKQGRELSAIRDYYNSE